ncbi:SDR family NAD(P)-dependent oxidoreductase [Nocardia pseudovaccinii]|uniref:SDR family NAD(P)-dependent oxidoreductase n=1 Tax=Nocardia pseudovaccinii TaxID=189540 RepID=UPI003D8F27DA
MIVGAGPGVSGALAQIYGQEGARIALLGIDQGALDEVSQRVSAAGGTAVSQLVDITDADGAKASIAALAAKLTPVDVLHFNPSTLREADPLTLTSDQLLADVRLGVGSLLTVLQAVHPALQRGSRITVTGSVAADKPWFGAASLGVQKAGVRNLVHSIDARLKDDGIRAASVTVHGLLSSEGSFTPAKVAQQLRAAIDQDESDWRTEIDYLG